MIKADKDIVITITGADVQKVAMICELAERYERGLQRTLNVSQNMFDEFSSDEIKVLRNTINQLSVACK